MRKVYGIQWNLSNPDTLGAEESVLISVISGVELYRDLAFGIAKCPVYQLRCPYSGCPD